MKKKNKKPTKQKPVEFIFTNLPGMKGIPVINSKPILVKENSSRNINEEN